jgi:hypothetical protein
LPQVWLFLCGHFDVIDHEKRDLPLLAADSHLNLALALSKLQFQSEFLHGGEYWRLLGVPSGGVTASDLAG